MSFFHWFKGAPSHLIVVDDRIWLTKRAKLNGIQRAISEVSIDPKPPHAVILVAHFQDCFDELEQIVQNIGTTESIIVVSSRSIQRDSTTLRLFNESQFVEILVAEHHPLSTHDDAVMKFAQDLPCRCRLGFHVSLEDAFLRAVCGEWVKNLLKRLGSAEDEAIESKLVTRQIKASQKKIGARCRTDFPADSAANWIEKNCPEI